VTRFFEPLGDALPLGKPSQCPPRVVYSSEARWLPPPKNVWKPETAVKSRHQRRVTGHLDGQQLCLPCPRRVSRRFPYREVWRRVRDHGFSKRWFPKIGCRLPGSRSGCSEDGRICSMPSRGSPDAVCRHAILRRCRAPDRSKLRATMPGREVVRRPRRSAGPWTWTMAASCHWEADEPPPEDGL